MSVASSADGTELVAVVNGGGIYTSTNNGVVWDLSSAPSPQNWVSIASSSDGANLVSAISGGGLYTSTDRGAHWDLQTSAPSPSDWVSVASSADGMNLVALTNTGDTDVYTSTDRGLVWTLQPLAPSFITSIESSLDGTKLTAVVKNGDFYTSTDSGISWEQGKPPSSGEWTPFISGEKIMDILPKASSAALYVVPFCGTDFPA